MKLKLAVLKKPTYIIGGIVLFFLVLWLVNKSGSSSNSGTVVASGSGQDPAAIAAGVALQQAQIGAGVQVAAINADLAKSQTDADTALKLAAIQATTATQTLEAQSTIAQDTLSLQGHVVDSNNQLAYNTAKMAYDNANYSTAVNANLQATLAADSLKAFTTSTLAGQIATVSHKRGEQFLALQNLINQSNAPAPSSAYTAPPLPQTSWVG